MEADCYEQGPETKWRSKNKRFQELLQQYPNPILKLRTALAEISELLDDESEDFRKSWKAQLIKAAYEQAERIQAYIKERYPAYLKKVAPPWYVRDLAGVKRKGLGKMLLHIHHLNWQTKDRERYYQMKPLRTVDAIRKLNNSLGVSTLYEGKWPLSLIQLNAEFYRKAATACACSESQVKNLVSTFRAIGILQGVLDRPGRGRLRLVSDGYFVDFKGRARKQPYFTKRDYGANMNMLRKTRRCLTGKVENLPHESI